MNTGAGCGTIVLLLVLFLCHTCICLIVHHSCFFWKQVENKEEGRWKITEREVRDERVMWQYFLCEFTSWQCNTSYFFKPYLFLYPFTLMHFFFQMNQGMECLMYAKHIKNRSRKDREGPHLSTPKPLPGQLSLGIQAGKEESHEHLLPAYP